MKLTIKLCLLVGSLYSPLALWAQQDSIHLVCPFEHGSGREPKEAYTWNPPDKKIIMISQVDTIIRSSITGNVSNINPTEDNRYEIVVYYKHFYFWYYGVTVPLVKKGQSVRAGQAIGTYTMGLELEFRMFKDEEPIDPRNLLECKVPKADQ
jgi:hypothetical protein